MKEVFSMGRGNVRIFCLSIAFIGVWLCARYLFPLTAPFALGLALALAAEPAVSFLNRRLRLPRSFSCALGVSLAFSLLTMTAVLLGAFLFREIKSLSAALPDLGNAARSGIRLVRDRALAMTDRVPEGLQPLMRRGINTLFRDGASLLDRAAPFALSFAGNLLSQVPGSALTLGTGLLSAYLISVRLPALRRRLLARISPERLKTVLSALKRIRRALGGWLLAQGKLMGITLVLLLAGFLLLRIPRAVFWALGVTLLDAFPVLGTGTVLLPWSLLCLLRADTARAVGLLGLYATVTLIRTSLEPKLLGRHLGLDPLATLICMYTGYKLWGVTGMLLSPMLAVIALQLVPQRR